VRRLYGRLLDTLLGDPWGIAIPDPAGGCGLELGLFVFFGNPYRQDWDLGFRTFSVPGPPCRETFFIARGAPRSTATAPSIIVVTAVLTGPWTWLIHVSHSDRHRRCVRSFATPKMAAACGIDVVAPSTH